MNDAGVLKSAFHTHKGHYEYMFTPFGLYNIVVAFQSIMNNLLKPFLQKYVSLFL